MAGQQELLYLFDSMATKPMGRIYRWVRRIIAGVQAFQSRGFKRGSTHLKELAKLKKLVALLIISRGLGISPGIYPFKRQENK